MKRLISIFLTLNALFVINVGVKANEVIGYSTYTDVVTYINHYPIPSYNFNGATLIAAEDLKSYGFDVFWNEYKWSLTISRNQSNEISSLITFKPAANEVGKRNLTITKTNVLVFTDNYQYASFGGIDGKTLINVEDLRCINGVSVVWVPEINAMKVWVDGLEMRETPQTVMRWKDFKYYDSCNGLDTWFYWQWHETDDYFILCLAEMASKNSSTYVDCFGTLRITDVINADGQSILKRSYFAKTERASMSPYAFGLTDYLMSRYIILTKDDLYDNPASDKGGLIRFSYSCSGSSVSDTIRVSILPH